MYRIPQDLNLTPIIGQFTTQLRVGQFDLQFTLGPVDFAITSPITLMRDDKPFAQWSEGRWPDPGFYDIMNTDVKRFAIPNDRLVIIEFENDIEMHLEDDSDQYECMVITIQGDPVTYIV